MIRDLMGNFFHEKVIITGNFFNVDDDYCQNFFPLFFIYFQLKTFPGLNTEEETFW